LLGVWDAAEGAMKVQREEEEKAPQDEAIIFSLSSE